jgi:hypothetical protein
MYKKMKKIVEVGNKHGNGDEFTDFVDLFFFFGIKNVRVGSKILGSVKKKSRPTDPNFEDHAIRNTHIFFWPKYFECDFLENIYIYIIQCSVNCDDYASA